MKYSELVKQGHSRLFKAGISDATTDAFILLESICNISKTEYFLKMNEEVEDGIESQYFAAIDKRSTHYPLQYIVGEWQFMGLDFKVNESVLIPRQDTEVLVEKVLEILKREYKKEKKTVKILDMCTGSGCIGISLAKLFKNSVVVAIDKSDDALQVARENALINNIDNIEFICSDLFEKVVINENEEKFDIIVSNPPYISTTEIENLMPEVKNYEPRMALDGDEDGLLFYRRIIEESKLFIKDKGFLVFEIGCTQAESVKELMRMKYGNLEVYEDLAGLDRVVVGQKK